MKDKTSTKYYSITLNLSADEIQAMRIFLKDEIKFLNTTINKLIVGSSKNSNLSVEDCIRSSLIETYNVIVKKMMSISHEFEAALMRINYDGCDGYVEK